MQNPSESHVPFVGWKGLRATADGVLMSPVVAAVWPARERFEARCDRYEEHEPPMPGCSCGVYAVKSFEDLMDARYNWSKGAEFGEVTVWVVAEVSLWGNVRRGQIGYRASFGYPKRVFVPAHKLELASAIRSRYGCETGVIDRFTGQGR